MVIIGLTGSIGMGKTATAQKFRTLRVPVFDSDARVHDLMKPDGKAFNAIIEQFPDCLTNKIIDRQKLGAAVFNNDRALKKLEAIVHPIVQAQQVEFVKENVRLGTSQVVLDIPLLYETGAENRCDVVVVASAPRHLQNRRVLARPGMSAQKYVAILARQIPDYIKRRRADFVVSTAHGHNLAFARIKTILSQLKNHKGLKWPPGQAGSQAFDLYGQLHHNLSHKSHYKPQDKHHA